MESEIVLFLREHVPAPALHAALADIFGLPPDDVNALLIVEYPQGFAIGISIPGEGAVPAQDAARKLASRLDTVVLLESYIQVNDGSHWMLFMPGKPRPRVAQILELRHGLDVADPLPLRRRAARFAFA